ncbi:MAG: VCBS repeat-containing protein, partial [Candidatus Latescibacteria bacterium]|nr:VCBS repeat-containing protein [Candidatus Latescibacterota bacterium]
MWKLLLTAAGLLLLRADLAQAITWNFDEDGNTQGWQARMGTTAGGPITAILPSAVSDGIWRIRLSTSPADTLYPGAALVSPLIDHDSALFDRVSIRFRVTHTRPLEGYFGVAWINSRNKDVPGYPGGLELPDEDPQGSSVLSFHKGGTQLFTTDWQEVTIGDLKTASFAVDDKLVKQVWEGLLSSVAIHMGTFEYSRENGSLPYIPDLPTEMAEALEVDWIRLTGVEEQLQGELSPPVVNPLGPPGQLFSSSQFIPLNQRGIYGIESSPFVDLGGDGDLDLILTWWGDKLGLVSAENDGRGGFHPGRLPVPAYSGGFMPILVGGADVNGDGKGDVLFKLSNDIEVLLSTPGEEEVYTQEVVASGMLPRGLADYEGDGDLDLWLSPATLGGLSLLSVWLNDGRGHFTQGADFTLGKFFPKVIEDLDRDGRADVVWFPRIDFPQPAIKVSPGIREWGLDKSYLLEIDSAGADSSFRVDFIKSVGDYDGDGDLDAILVSEWENEISDNFVDSAIPSRGLRI